MEDQKDTYKEVQELLKPELKEEVKKTDAEISMEFLTEYKKLVRKYGRDFVQGDIKVVKMEFITNENESI
jgi:uncharacterized protein (DUF2164 family)